MLGWTVVTALATASMAFFSWRLVVVSRQLRELQQSAEESAREFQDWNRQRLTLREEPEIIIQGCPKVRIGDHSAASEIAVLSMSMLVSNPGELLTSLLSVAVKHSTTDVLGGLVWTWTSLHPMLSLPVTQLSGDSNVAKELLITDALPAPVFTGGLVKLESNAIQLPFASAEKLKSEPTISLECEYRPGNRETRKTTVSLEVQVDWTNH